MERTSVKRINQQRMLNKNNALLRESVINEKP